MKRTAIILTVTGLSLAAISCSNKEENGGQDGQVSLQITGGVAATKADGSLWTSDKIGVTALASESSSDVASYVNYAYATDADGVATANFTAVSGSIVFTGENSHGAFTAYAPYAGSNGSFPPTDGVIAVNTADQSDPAALDFLYVDGAKTASYNSPSLTFNFTHRMSKLIVNIVSDGTLDSEALAELRAGTYTLSGLVQEGTFTVAPDDADCGTVLPGSAVSDLVLSTAACPFTRPDTADGDDYDGIAYSAILIPQTPDADLTLTLSIGSYDERTATIPAATFGAGYSYTYTIKVSAGSGSAVEAVLDPSGCTVSDWVVDDGSSWSTSVNLGEGEGSDDDDPGVEEPDDPGEEEPEDPGAEEGWQAVSTTAVTTWDATVWEELAGIYGTSDAWTPEDYTLYSDNQLCFVNGGGSGYKFGTTTTDSGTFYRIQLAGSGNAAKCSLQFKVTTPGTVKFDITSGNANDTRTLNLYVDGEAQGDGFAAEPYNTSTPVAPSSHSYEISNISGETTIAIASSSSGINVLALEWVPEGI